MLCKQFSTYGRRIIGNDFPVATTRQDGAFEFRSLEAAAFENDCGSVPVRTFAYRMKVLHVTFEVEQKLKAGLACQSCIDNAVSVLQVA